MSTSQRLFRAGALVQGALATAALLMTASCNGSGSTPPGPPQNATAAAPAAAPAASPMLSGEEAARIENDDRQAEQEAEQVYGLPDISGKKWTGDLDGMLQRRVIRVLTTFSKVNYFVDQGRPRGLVYDAFRLFEDDLNAKLKTKNIKVHIVFVPVAHDDLIPALVQGRGDIVSAGTLQTEWRKAQVDFTKPTRSGISSVVVTNTDAPPVPTVADLGGRDVYIRKSDVSREGVDQFNAELAKAGKPPARLVPAPEVLAAEDILEMVNAGLVQTTIVEDYLAQFWQRIFPNIVINPGAAVKTDGRTGMMVRKNSPQLLAELNAFITKYPEGSSRRNMLFNEYLKNVKWAKSATANSERAKFEQTVDMFRKYSGQYKLDFLLMAAQGYQESQLNQDAKSPVGAIGVMQVMPATGKELKVGDITKIEPNIHAGVKYVRFMMDRYYANEKMTPLNKGLFTFASYNAGPARIQDMRQRAAKRGLDPNVWFNNVEVIAAERIGRETVQYVANIYKYYLAYTLLTQQRDARQKAMKRTPGQ